MLIQTSSKDVSNYIEDSKVANLTLLTNERFLMA
jgi:hypothetical protein